MTFLFTYLCIRFISNIKNSLPFCGITNEKRTSLEREKLNAAPENHKKEN